MMLLTHTFNTLSTQETSGVLQKVEIEIFLVGSGCRGRYPDPADAAAHFVAKTIILVT
jgi:uncharacterized protein